MVAAGAGERALVNPAPLFPIHVAEHEPALRAGECLVRARAEDVRPFAQRVLELLARDQAEDVRTVVDDLRADLPADLEDLLHRLREQEQALAENHQAGPRGADQVARLGHVRVVAVLRERKGEDVPGVFPHRAGALMADVAAAGRRIRQDDVARPDVAAEDGLIRVGAGDGADLAVQAREERLQVALHVGLDGVNLVRALIIAFAGVSFGVAMAEVGTHHAAGAAAQDLFAGDEVDAGTAPLFLFADERLDAGDVR